MPPKSKNNRNYFTQETEDAILLYNKTESPNQRSKIYSKSIHYPFFKLTQNIIHTFKFYNTEVEDLEHLQHEIIVFLLDKMHLYHHSKSIDDRLFKIINKKHSSGDYKKYFKGNHDWDRIYDEEKDETIFNPITEEQFKKRLEKNTNFALEFGLYQKGLFLTHTNDSDKITLEQIKEYIKKFEGKLSEECMKELKRLTPPKAYSYFGTIVKRWLINYNKKNYSKKINSSPIDDISHSLNFSYDLDSSNLSIDQTSDFLDEFVLYVYNNIDDFFPKPNDALIADAILQIFKNRSTLEIFHKKALYIYIREQGNFKTQKITKIAEILSDIFKEEYIFFLENGYINFKNA